MGRKSGEKEGRDGGGKERGREGVEEEGKRKGGKERGERRKREGRLENSWDSG